MTLKQMLGLDIRADRYKYEVDPDVGYVSAQKVPDKWVSTKRPRAGGVSNDACDALQVIRELEDLERKFGLNVNLVGAGDPVHLNLMNFLRLI